MFAILKTGGKQYRVSEGSFLDIEKLETSDKNIIFNEVLFIQDDNGNILVGKPILENTSIKASVIDNYKDKKVVIFKKSRRKNHRRKNGHRQMMTRVRIENINYK